LRESFFLLFYFIFPWNYRLNIFLVRPFFLLVCFCLFVVWYFFLSPLCNSHGSLKLRWKSAGTFEKITKKENDEKESSLFCCFVLEMPGPKCREKRFSPLAGEIVYITPTYLLHLSDYSYLHLRHRFPFLRHRLHRRCKLPDKHKKKTKKKQSRIFLQEQQHKWNKTKYIEEKPQMARTKKKKKGNTFLFLNMYNKKEENKFKLNEINWLPRVPPHSSTIPYNFPSSIAKSTARSTCNR
jgi:hypothetical protein